jgi:hypothetical protein
VTHAATESHYKGRLAEVKVLGQFAAWGCEVAPVLGENTSCDLLALRAGNPCAYRVEVKAASFRGKSRWPVATIGGGGGSSGGNRKHTPIDTDRFDILAVYCEEWDLVFAWWASQIDVKHSWTLTRERQAAAITDGAELDLVEVAVMEEREVGGLCLCGVCGAMHSDARPSLADSADHSLADSGM